MPNIFKVEPYQKRIEQEKARIGDVVYLTANPELPMTVCVFPHRNRAAGTTSKVVARFRLPDGTFTTDEFDARELSS